MAAIIQNTGPSSETPPAKASPVVVVVDKALSSTANLVKLLPSGTVPAFQALSPSFSNRGACHYASNRYLTGALVCFCVAACGFFSFTDSPRGGGGGGKLYYGVATLSGLYILNYDDDDDDKDDDDGRCKVVLGDMRRYRLRILDGVHAVLAVMVFLTVALGDTDVQNYFFPGAGPSTRQLLENLAIGAGVVSSLLFMVFPTTRKGIGYSDHVAHHLN